MKKIIEFIRDLYGTKEFIPLHEPKFIGKEKDYLSQCIDSTFVSTSNGVFTEKLENQIKDFTGSSYCLALINGTSALHLSLLGLGLKNDDEVIIQVMNFVAGVNAISYCGAKPLFVDCEKDNLGICPIKLEEFLKKETFIDENGNCCNRVTGNLIKVCIITHLFGHPSKITELKRICDNYNIKVLEDAAEAFGSCYNGKKLGTFGEIGIFSFNGNKIITGGGGGAIVTNDKNLYLKLKHLATTAKITQNHNFFHDETGYNYRLPNLNSAVLSAQMENIQMFIENKRETASLYQKFFEDFDDILFFTEKENCFSNYWLNSIIFEKPEDRNKFLEYSEKNNIQIRPVWILNNKYPMYKNCFSINLENSQYLEDRLINLPSSVRL